VNGKKPVILFLYGVALYFVLRTYYKQNNTGLPNPVVIRNPTYLYGILAIASDFTGGLTIPLAAGMTLALIWQTNNKQASATQNGTPKTSTPSQTPTTGSKASANPGAASVPKKAG